jgi:hypothetical protein
LSEALKIGVEPPGGYPGLGQGRRANGAQRVHARRDALELTRRSCPPLFGM